MQELQTGRIAVFAYDPGLTTGWAIWHPQTKEFHAGEVKGRHAFVDFFDGVVGAGVPVEVAGEKFTINAGTASKSPQYDALYLNGYVDALSYKLGFPFKEQTPAQAKRFATDDKLKAVGWHTPTPGGHANDGARHLLTYVCGARAELGGAGLLERIVEGLGL